MRCRVVHQMWPVAAQGSPVAGVNAAGGSVPPQAIGGLVRGRAGALVSAWLTDWGIAPAGPWGLKVTGSHGQQGAWDSRQLLHGLPSGLCWQWLLLTGSALVRAQCAGAGVCRASGVSAGVVACARGRWCVEVAAAVSLVWWLALAAPGWDVAIRGLISIAMAPPSRPRRASRNTMQQDRKR